ncbi:MAG: hypothetical protein WC942_11175, partial [Clostridia bacterium]
MDKKTVLNHFKLYDEIIERMTFFGREFGYICEGGNALDVYLSEDKIALGAYYYNEYGEEEPFYIPLMVFCMEPKEKTLSIYKEVLEREKKIREEIIKEKNKELENIAKEKQEIEEYQLYIHL